MPPEDDNQVFDDKANNQECDEDCELFCPADLMSFAWQIARGMVRRYSWFATTWQGGHVVGQYNRNFTRKIYMKIDFSSQRREMLLFLTTNMAAVTSRANEQLLRSSFFLEWMINHT